MYKILYRSELNTSQAVARIESEIPDGAEKKTLLDFIANSKRGLTK